MRFVRITLVVGAIWDKDPAIFRVPVPMKRALIVRMV